VRMWLSSITSGLNIRSPRLTMKHGPLIQSVRYNKDLLSMACEAYARIWNWTGICCTLWHRCRRKRVTRGAWA